MSAQRGRAVTITLSMVAALSACRQATPTVDTRPRLFINEVMAENDDTLPDPSGYGGFADWIEIYNAGSAAVDMSGMHLSDDPDRPSAWRVPEGVVIGPGGFLIFWADNDAGQGPTHTNFKLAAGGESITLSDTSAEGYRLIDELTFGPMSPDESLARIPDGGPTWRIASEPTPGEPNR